MCAGAPHPHTRFLLQESEQVLPGPLLPHHCALQVRAEGLWAGVRMKGDRTAPGRGPEVGHSWSPPPLWSSPRVYLPCMLPACVLDAG